MESEKQLSQTKEIVSQTCTTPIQKENDKEERRTLCSVSSYLLCGSDECVHGFEDIDDEENISWKRARLFKKMRDQLRPLMRTNYNKHVLDAALHSTCFQSKKCDQSTCKSHSSTSQIGELSTIFQSTKADENESTIESVLPDLPELQEEELLKDNGIYVFSNSRNPISPPPPPPPLQPVKFPTTSENKRINSNFSPPPTDIHALLMDAIRKAGGIPGGHLRATKADALSPLIPFDTSSSAKTQKPQNSFDKKHQQTTIQKLNQSSQEPVKDDTSAENLKSDLHIKLLMRRRGICGSNSSDDSLRTTDSTPGSTQRGISVMNRLSQWIPPPTPKKPNAENTRTNPKEVNDSEWNE